MISEKYVKLMVGLVILFMTVAVLYRTLVDRVFGGSHVAGIAVVAALALLFLVIDRVKEFTASSKGITAKLEKLNSEVSDIHNFMLKGIDRDSSDILNQIKNGNIPRPVTDKDRNSLKFRLRVLREKAYILRDEAKCDSISDAVKEMENIAECFVITQLGEEHLRQLEREANDKVNMDTSR